MKQYKGILADDKGYCIGTIHKVVKVEDLRARLEKEWKMLDATRDKKNAFWTGEPPWTDGQIYLIKKLLAELENPLEKRSRKPIACPKCKSYHIVKLDKDKLGCCDCQHNFKEAER
jgi:hypothetical protein